MKLPTPRQLDKAGGDAWAWLDSIEREVAQSVPASEQDAVNIQTTLARIHRLRISYFGDPSPPRCPVCDAHLGSAWRPGPCDDCDDDTPLLPDRWWRE